jgi:NADH pyrophosphatase NudC (nudix superfamily)
VNQQNTSKLIQAFPNLYRTINQETRKDATRYYFQIGDGWFDLVFELSQKINDIAQRQNLTVEKWPDVKMVESHYASLRFKLVNDNNEMFNLSMDYEQKSLKVCEDCGQPGKRREGGWEHTLCDHCDNQG